MRLRLTRDSVAAGDDVGAPHLSIVDLPDASTTGDLCGWVRSARPIASVEGGSTWALRVEDRVVAVLGDGPRDFVETDPATSLLPEGRPLTAHLEYLLHDDVDTVVARVREEPTRTDLRRLARDR
jgi:hypothetical protein